MTTPNQGQGNLSAKVTHTETTEVEQPVEPTDTTAAEKPDGKTDSDD